MGKILLTRRHWLLFLLEGSIISMLAGILWRMIASFLTPQPLHTHITILVLCCCATCLFFLVWLRQMQARLMWVRVWIFISPVFLTSFFLFPILPFAPFLALAILLSMLFALWGYYARFYPMVGLDTRLHRARYAHWDELADLLSATPAPISLLLGVNRLRSFFLVRSIPIRHELGSMLIVGPTRCGKGLLATSQLLTWGGSVVVNDIKGDLFSATAGYRSTLGPVFVLDPTGIGHRYDPLLNKQTEDKLLSSAARLLFKPDEGDGAIFTQRATVMLSQLFLAARKENALPLPYVRQMIRSGLPSAAEQLHEISPDLATQFLDVSFEKGNFTDRFLLSAWGTLTARMRPLLTETVIRCFAGADFMPEELMCSEKPISVYLRWPEQDLLVLSPLVRLLWGSIIDELILTYDKKEGKGCKPVLLVVDEAGRTAIPSLADHATTVVGRGVSLWIAIQSLSQLEAIYGKARAQVLKDNMESQVYYRPTDLATAEYLEHRLGRKSAYAKSTTERGKMESSHGESEQGVPLLTAQEIMQLKDHQILGFHRQLPPFKIHRIDWRKHDILKHRQGMQTPTLSPLPEVPERRAVQHQAVSSPEEFIDPDEVASL